MGLSGSGDISLDWMDRIESESYSEFGENVTKGIPLMALDASRPVLKPKRPAHSEDRNRGSREDYNNEHMELLPYRRLTVCTSKSS
jgi:hypothetical protein